VALDAVQLDDYVQLVHVAGAVWQAHLRVDVRPLLALALLDVLLPLRRLPKASTLRSATAPTMRSGCGHLCHKQTTEQRHMHTCRPLLGHCMMCTMSEHCAASELKHDGRRLIRTSASDGPTLVLLHDTPDIAFAAYVGRVLTS
jgi:hypothetical protein